MTTSTLARLRGEAAEALRAYVTSPEGEGAEHLRKAATALVSARAEFLDREGRPDWRGRSYAYRRFAASVYDTAGLDDDLDRTIRGALRYHVGNVLRDRLPAETLEEIGLSDLSPRERSAEKRARQHIILAAAEGGSMNTPEEALSAVDTARGILQRVRLHLDDWGPEQRATLAVSLAAVMQAAAALSSQLSAMSGGGSLPTV